MNAVGAAFLIVAAVLIFALPRRYAALPLLVGALYMTEGQQLIIAGAHFTMPRMLVVISYLRVLFRGERLEGGLRGVDRLLILWAVLIVLTTPFHESDTWAFRLGIIWTEFGAYFLFRIFLHNVEDIQQFFKALVFTALPLTVLLIMEKRSGIDPFAALGGIERFSAIRNDSIRAAGPFSHAILAGSVGAAFMAMSFALYPNSKLIALIGCVAGAGIVYAATSSSPMLMVIFVGLAWGCWKLRDRMRMIRWGIVGGLVALSIVMKAPIYYLMARVDVVGGSQGWFRAKLLESAIAHLSEWWLVGTDVTRHWMATGVTANEQHTDMTNHFLTMGVTGGLPLLIVFVLIVISGFRNAGRALQSHANSPVQQQMFIWGLGATLFGMIMNFFSITLFDQSVLFFWLIIASLASARGEAREPVTEPARKRVIRRARGRPLTAAKPKSTPVEGL